MSNPLLEQHQLPPFSRIQASQVEPAIRQLIERNKQAIERLLADNERYTWDNLWQPIEELEDELSQAWSPVAHLNGVCNSDALRKAYNACLPLLSEYGTWMGQHQHLYRAYLQISESPEFTALDAARRKALENVLRDFRLAGVALPPEQKARYAELRKRLSELGSRFSDNVLDATNAWSKQVDKEQLRGLPETALASARQAAERAGLEGYLINLEFPSYYPVLTYCDDAGLREEVYRANCTRASDEGPNAGQWDNSALIEETLALRHELARLLGFANYAELSLATKMADTPAQVREFLEQLAQQSRPQAEDEWHSLQAFARDEYGAADVNAWDVSYYSEKLRQQCYQVSQEELRPYLPITRVLPGLFAIVERLYGISVRETTDFDRYHADVRLFELCQGDEVIARFYLDLYARPHKRGGAWMDTCRARRLQGGELQIPVAYLVCNFTAPVGDTPALLSHNELTTLFHEFGHGLHHMLTGQTVAAVSGINGVAWDAVELPSQFLENWCWQREALELISGHYQSGEPLPATLLDRLLAARSFQAAMMLARQVEFALFDLRLHSELQPDGGGSVQGLLDEVRAAVAVVPTPAYNRFQNSFTHIFAGGYAAGYYSYKWAEVLSADAFSRFEEEGIFNRETGAAFREHILHSGGSRDAMELFVAFRGRPPSLEPLLRHSGITPPAAA
ncbi:MAG: oligopeptidase A [Halieaceae bacterium]|nr:oligopeptidase A [Halieaceae bacterium]MCP5204790.1 oligopeptidase A [Pseudomonadales bacterium]